MATTFKQVDSNMLHTTLKIKQNLDFVTKGLSANALVNFKNWSSSEYNRTIEPYYYRVKENSYDPKNPVSYELERLGTSGKQYIAESGITRSGDRTIFMQFQINYTRQFGKHNVGGMLMYMQREYRNGTIPNRNQGFSGRFTYDYDHRYDSALYMGNAFKERKLSILKAAYEQYSELASWCSKRGGYTCQYSTF